MPAVRFTGAPLARPASSSAIAKSCERRPSLQVSQCRANIRSYRTPCAGLRAAAVQPLLGAREIGTIAEYLEAHQQSVRLRRDAERADIERQIGDLKRLAAQHDAPHLSRAAAIGQVIDESPVAAPFGGVRVRRQIREPHRRRVSLAGFEQPDAVTRLVRLHVHGTQGVGDMLPVGGNLGLRDAVQSDQILHAEGLRRIRRRGASRRGRAGRHCRDGTRGSRELQLRHRLALKHSLRARVNSQL